VCLRILTSGLARYTQKMGEMAGEVCWGLVTGL